MSCAPQPLVAGSRRWRHRVRLDEAVISSRGGVRFFCLPEPLSPSGHLRARVPPPLFWRCQSLTGGAHTAGDQCCPGVVFQPGHLQGGLQGAPPARIFTRKMGLLSAAQNFLPLRGANKVAPLRRRKLFEGGGARKIAAGKSCCRGHNSPSAQSGATVCGVRAVALAPNSTADFLLHPRALSTGKVAEIRLRGARTTPLTRPSARSHPACLHAALDRSPARAAALHPP